MKSAIKNGLIAALVLSVLYFIVYYLIDPKLNFRLIYPMVSSAIIYLIFMLRSATEERKKMGGSLGFGEALLSAMACFAIASFLYLVTQFVHLKLDPNIIGISQEAYTESLENFFSFIGESDDEILEELEDLDEDQVSIYSPSTYLLIWFGNLLFPGLFVGVIAAAIAKKNVPLD